MFQKPAPGKEWDGSLVTAFWGTFLPGLTVGLLTIGAYEKLLAVPLRYAALPAGLAAIFTPAFVACTLRWRIPIFSKVLVANLFLGLLVSVLAEPMLAGRLSGIAYSLPPAFAMAWLSHLTLDRNSRYRPWIYAGFATVYLVGQIWRFLHQHG